MYYKKQKIKGKWYPRSITASKYETKDVAERLAAMSTVSLGDAYAVLVGLGEVLGDMMRMGNSVKLDGLGTFYLVGKANGEGRYARGGDREPVREGEGGLHSRVPP